MKILVVGAGALGGYYGGRLLLAGKEVTFLIRPGRALELQKTGGLKLEYPGGEDLIPGPPHVFADQLKDHYDLIILACKSYSLENCITSLTPAVGHNTMILPLLNGLGHIDRLSDVFGREHVLGGRCIIFAALNALGHVIQQAPGDSLTFGELNGADTDRIRAVEQTFAAADFESNLSFSIMEDMWAKWVRIAALAGITSLMRATIGDIVVAKAEDYSLSLLKECTAIAEANGFPQRTSDMEAATKLLTGRETFQAASMMKDIEKGQPTEARHILAELLSKAPKGKEFPILKICCAHVMVYEARRLREAV